MQLHPDMEAPDAPTIHGVELLDSELIDYGILIQNNLIEMSQHCRNLVSAIALFGFCRSQEGLGRFSAEWSFVAARDGAMSLRNFAHSIFHVRGAIGKIPEWLDLIDARRLKKAHKRFESEFPFAHKLRHAVAHPEFYSDPKKEMGTRDKLNIDGLVVSEVGSRVIINSGIFNNKFACTFEGELIEYDLSPKTCLSLVDICRSSFDSFSKIARV